MPQGLPTISAKLPEGILNLAVAAGLASSNSEARKLIANNGLKLNDTAVSDPRLTVDSRALQAGSIQAYLIYIFITLLVLLMFAL